MLIKYSAHNLSKQVSQIDFMLEKKSVVSLKCSEIVSHQNVKLVGHIQNLVRQCLMTDCYFQLCNNSLLSEEELLLLLDENSSENAQFN